MDEKDNLQNPATGENGTPATGMPTEEEKEKKPEDATSTEGAGPSEAPSAPQADPTEGQQI